MREEEMTEYVRKDSPTGNGEWIEHLGGVDWYYAPTPRRFHRCWPQTRGWMDRELVERCACGGIRFDGNGPWVDRNRCEQLSPAEQAARMAQHERDKRWDDLIGQFDAAERKGDRDQMRDLHEQISDLMAQFDD